MRTLLAIGLLAAACHSAQAQELRTYMEPRFGTAAHVPAGWRSEPLSSAGGSGSQFVSPDGDTWIAVYGMRAETQAGGRNARDIGFAENENVTYRADGAQWFVRSGFKQRERIFYRKAVFSCGGRVAHLLAFEYPAAEKGEHDRLVTLIARSLRAGRGSEAC